MKTNKISTNGNTKLKSTKETKFETGRCGKECKYLIDKETKKMYIYGNGNIESFESIDDEIDIIQVIIQEGPVNINKLPEKSTIETIEYNGIQEIECTTSFSRSTKIVGIKIIEEYPKSTICGMIVSRKFGSINDDIKWMINDEGKLIIYGKGEIPNYTKYELPEWNKYKDQITRIEIKEGITEIGDYSMKGLSKVTEITISKTIERIGMYVFEDCISLIVINVNSENEYLISNEGILFNKDKSELIQYPIGNQRTNYTIPEETETIRIESSTICYKLENIEVNENNQHFISIE